MAGQATYDLVLHKDADPTTNWGCNLRLFDSRNGRCYRCITYDQPVEFETTGNCSNAEFPAMALVHHEVPKHPVRVYQGDGVGVFTAEVRFGPERDVLFANTVLEWFTKGGFDQLIVIDGVARENLDDRTILFE